MSASGQTISDRLLAARHSLAGQGLAKSVCKATTEEMIGPKKKHLDCKCKHPLSKILALAKSNFFVSKQMSLNERVRVRERDRLPRLLISKTRSLFRKNR
jgi:hypothetical protein